MALVVLAGTAAVLDARTRRIPNWLVGPALLVAFVLQVALRGWAGARDAALGSALAFGIYFLLFAVRAMGAGDVKLMTAVGAMLGPGNWLVTFIVASVLGAILGIVLTARNGTLLRTGSNVLLILNQLLHMKAPFQRYPELDIAHADSVSMPHAVPVAFGCLAYLTMARMHL